MSTYDLRRLAARVQNAQIRLHDIGWQLDEAGYPDEGKTAAMFGRMLEGFVKKLNRMADKMRDPRGAEGKTESRS
jgi:hypothetical protein